MRVECNTGWISEVCKLNVVARKRYGKPKKKWDVVVVDVRKKLGIESADPQNHPQQRGHLLGRFVR